MTRLGWALVFCTLLIIAAAVALVAWPSPTRAPILPAGETPDPQEASSTPYADLITVSSPRSGDMISSPLTISGEARGTWYFEASFPVTLTDWDGRIIAEGHAEAQGDWMTEEFVPFTAVLTFDVPPAGDPQANRGTLILHNDNPSGLPENDKAVEIPVFFK